jgi:hypothetical protein
MQPTRRPLRPNQSLAEERTPDAPDARGVTRREAAAYYATMSILDLRPAPDPGKACGRRQCSHRQSAIRVPPSGAAQRSFSIAHAGWAPWFAACLAAALCIAPAGAATVTGPVPGAGGAPGAGSGAAPAPSHQDAAERVLDVTLVPAEGAHSTPAAAGGPAAGARPQGSPAPAPNPSAAAAPAAENRSNATPARRALPSSASGHGLQLLAIILAAAAVAGRIIWRRRPRRCPQCGTAMRRLDDAAAFAELDMAERTEHLIGEVRYSVWRCGSCGAVTKTAARREVTTAMAAAGAPVGSATYLRHQAQSGLSIMPPRLPPPAQPGPWPEAATTAAHRGASPGSQSGDPLSPPPEIGPLSP